MTAPAAPPPLERLLEHRAWVRRVARSLVRDDSAADDLAQDVWLDAVARPPRDAASPRGWLARALRHNAADTGRAERRRDAREGAAARTRDAGDPADLIAEAELHRRVVDAVLSLDEPARGTLLLRYFDGLPPAAIAARQGVPVETVRTRIKRALASLRERFDREHGGDRRAWTALLAPLAGADVPGPAAPHPAPPPLVAAALGIAAGTACVVALVLAVRGDAPSNDAGGTATSPAGDARDAATLGGRPAARTPARAATDADAAESQSAAQAPLPADTWLAVHVIDEDLRAVPRATLSIAVPADAPEALRAWSRGHETDADGPFPVHGLPPEADGWAVRLTATAPGFTPAEAATVTLESGRTQVTRLVLSRPRTMRVRVTDAATGAPVPGARVVSRTECARLGVDGESAAAPKGDGWATTSDDGTAEIGGLGRGKHVVFADAPRHLPSVVSAPAGGTDAVGVALAPIPFPGRVRVVVRAPGGAAVAGTTVTLLFGADAGGAPPVLRTTDASGACVFDDLPPGRHFVVADPQAVLRAATGPVSSETSNRVLFRGCHTLADVAAGGDATAELGDVSGPARMVVRLVDAEGRPVAGRRVVVSPDLPRTTEADGTATFDGFREGDVLSLEVDGWYGTAATASADAKPVTWTIGPARVELVLRDPDGLPLPDQTTVQLVSGDRQGFVAVGLDGRRRIGVAGAVVAAEVPAGPLTLQAWNAKGRAAFAVVDVPPGGLGTGPGGRAEVTLRPCGTIRLRTPHDRVSLTVRGPNGTASTMWIDGSASVRSWISGPLAAGTYVVEGTVAGVPFRRDVEVRDGETTAVVE